MVVINNWTGKRDDKSAGVILGLRPANERRRYKVTPSLIGWAQTKNQPFIIRLKKMDTITIGVVSIQEVRYQS